MRRSFIRLCTGLFLLAFGSVCLAQDNAWPSKPLTLVVPFPPGNTADLVARVIAPPLSKALGQPVIIDNRPGAGGNIAAQAVARADKDGHLLLLTTGNPLVINPVIYKSTGFDPDRDFSPVAVIGTVPMVLVANKDFPPNTLAQFISYVRENGATTSYASVGQGTFTHMGMEMFLLASGLQATHIPYKGAAPAQTDLIGGRVQFMFDSIASSNGQLKGGRVKAIAVTSSTRSPFLQSTPTVAESSDPKLKDFEVVVWAGLFAPAGTPNAAVVRLNDEVNKILRSPEYQAQLASQFIRTSDPMNPDQFSALVKADRARWSKVAQDIGLELQ